MKKLLGGAGAAIGVKLLTGLAVAAAAVTVATAATEVATTGSLNPANWGQQVKQTVSDCKASAERLGVHGIGQCVSSFARQHGDTVSDSHGKAKKDNPGQDKKNTPGQGNGNNGNGNGKNKSKSNGNSSNGSDTSSTATETDATDPVAMVQVNIPPQP